MAKRFHVSQTIAAPAARVWALLADASSYPDWNPSIVSITGVISKGARIAVVSTINPKRTFTLTVTEMTEPTRMVWSDSMPLRLF